MYAIISIWNVYTCLYYFLHSVQFDDLQFLFIIILSFGVQLCVLFLFLVHIIIFFNFKFIFLIMIIIKFVFLLFNHFNIIWIVINILKKRTNVFKFFNYFNEIKKGWRMFFLNLIEKFFSSLKLIRINIKWNLRLFF